MKVLILGATGRTGKHLVNESLDKGHDIHVLVRDKNKFSTIHPNLKVFEGTPLSPDDIRNALKGCQAAISSLNISRKSDFPWSPLVSPPDLLSSSLKNLITGMKEEGISRVIIVSAAGAGDSWNLMPWWFKGFIKSSNIGITYKDHDLQEKLLEESGFDWTVVRPVGLSDDKVEGNLTISFNGLPAPGFKISRLEVARFMIREMTENNHIHKKPVISQKK
jgi:putative NADH-flavin reductase